MTGYTGRTMMIKGFIGEIRVAKWLGIFLAVSFLALYSFSAYTKSELADRAKPHYALIFAQEMTGFYTVLILLPAILLFMRRFPIERFN